LYLGYLAATKYNEFLKDHNELESNELESNELESFDEDINFKNNFKLLQGSNNF